MRVDFYTLIHKALRRLLFNFAVKAGTIDCSNYTAVIALQNDFIWLNQLLNEHAAHEENYFHPLIKTKLPNQAELFEQEHQALEGSLIELHNILFNKPLDSLYFYKRFNQFISTYLTHLSLEENTMPLLWETCTDVELTAALQDLITSFTAEQLAQSLDYMLPALAPDERQTLMATS